jgi:ketosteroid isomerase-like protein
LTSGRSSIVLLGAVLLLGACRIERTERPSLADPGSVARADIETALESFANALDGRDARRATTYFTPDAVLIIGGGPAHHGRGEIAIGLEQVLLGDSAALFLSSESIDLAGGIAWQIGSFEEVPADSASPANGRFVIRWQRGPEAAWRMQYVLLTSFTPDTSAAGS